MNCPCQSGKSYDLCCARFISYQKVAENAQQLMRSRYTAYVLNNHDYLLYSWHPDFRPADLKLDESIKWIGLEIIQHSSEQNNAIVEFEARLLVDGKVDALRERSQFIFENGQWFYTTGELRPPGNRSFKPGRNESCPCGSGLKFKRCCGK